MSEKVGSIHYDLSLRTADFDAKTASINSKLSSLGHSMTNIGTKMTVGLTLPIAIGVGVAIKAASDLNETINKVDVAFGSSSVAVKQWSQTSISSMGLAKQSALDAAALFGDMATSMGLPQNEAATLSMNLVQLGADLSSFKNIPIAESQTALAGIFTGETESLKRLGIVMTEVNLTEFARTQGITKTIQEMTQAEKVQLRYNYIMSVTKNAQGDFVRTSEGTANQLRQTQERFKELSATIGAQFLPTVNKILKIVQDVMARFTALSPKLQNTIIIVGLLVAVLGPLLIILGMVATAIAAISWPVVLVVGEIALLAAGIAYLQIKFKLFTNVFNEVRQAVLPFIALFKQYVLPVLQEIANFLMGQAKEAWNQLKAAFDQVKAAVEPFLPQLKILAMILGVVVVTPLIILIAVIGALIAVFVLAMTIIARVIAFFMSLWATVVGVASGIVGAIANVIGWLWNFWATTINVVSNIIGTFNNLRNNIWAAVSGFGSMLVGAGQALVNGLAQGIRNAAGGPINAIKDVVNRVRNYLPFSPAKEGPFSGKGWTPYSGQAMMEGLAQGINRAADIPRSAINNALQGSLQAAQVQVNPAIGQAPQAQPINIYGNIEIGDKQTADYFFNRLNRGQDLSSMGLGG